MFRGSFVALVTPLFDSGEVDWRSLEKLVHWHIESGTNGIVAVGTTGESATLSFEEHIQVVERTVQYAQGHIPVIAGSGANSTAEAIFLTKAMSKLSVDGFYFLCQGGDGVISVSANIAPAEMAQICQLAHEGKHAQAKEIDARLGKLHTELFVEPNPVMPKWALYKMGRMASAQLRLPLVLPELNSQKLIEERLNYLGLIK